MKYIMLRSFSTLALLLFLFTSTQAQLSVKGEPKILIKTDTPFQNPVWSPDGSRIAFTSHRYQGLWTANADGKQIELVTNKDAGYGFSWSSDSESILTRLSETVNRRRNHAIAVYDVSSKSETQLSEFRSEMPALPRWAQFDEKAVLITDAGVETFETGKQADVRQKAMPNAPFYVLKQDQIAKGMVPENSVSDISPFDEATYLNLSVSPDGQKLAFEVYGGNLYVMNVDGTGLIDLGRLNNPSWSPDSRFVLANSIKDDGYNFTQADIIASRVDGSESFNLTASTNLIALNPSWSPDGQRIAFDVPNEGAIYVLELIN